MKTWQYLYTHISRAKDYNNEHNGLLHIWDFLEDKHQPSWDYKKSVDATCNQVRSILDGFQVAIIYLHILKLDFISQLWAHFPKCDDDFEPLLSCDLRTWWNSPLLYSSNLPEPFFHVKPWNPHVHAAGKVRPIVIALLTEADAGLQIRFVFVGRHVLEGWLCGTDRLEVSKQHNVQ